MTNEKEQKFKLSYESDGEMGREKAGNTVNNNQSTEIAEEFFNTTQNSE